MDKIIKYLIIILVVMIIIISGAIILTKKMEKKDVRYYAKVHSVESFGTVY